MLRLWNRHGAFAFPPQRDRPGGVGPGPGPGRWHNRSLPPIGTAFHERYQAGAAPRHPQGQPAGHHPEALRARRLRPAHLGPLLLPRHRRSRDRVHPDPAAGDGALRRARACSTARSPASTGSSRTTSKWPSSPTCARRGRTTASVRWVMASKEDSPFNDRRGPAGPAHRHRGGRHDPALPRAARRRGAGRVLLGRDRGEAADPRRRDRRRLRDRLLAARQQPQGHARRAREHAALHRQSRRRSPTPGSATRSSGC